MIGSTFQFWIFVYLSSGITAYTYLGCFYDSSTSRVWHYTPYLIDTIEECTAHCRSLGKRYAGSEFGEECFCGDTYPDKGDASNCNYGCEGDTSKKCGGIKAMSVYFVCTNGTYKSPDGECGNTCACSEGLIGACHHINGGCPTECINGNYKAPQCQDCENGKYGSDCEDTCSVKCAGIDDPCDRGTGKCTNGCVDGWKRDQCTAPCSSGSYGHTCADTCGHCKTGDTCNHVDGICPDGCALGWIGTKCDSDCGPGKYGLDCDSMCDEHCGGDGNACHHASGECTNGCDSGWMGDKCDQECGPGKYGQDCNSRCNDNCNGDTCHHISGKCNNRCDPGWQSDKCDQECGLGTYGPDCKSRCDDNCDGDTCHHISGRCTNGCDPGWQNHKCDQKCETDKYGQDCNSRCNDNCIGDTCHHISGTCTNGCDPGWENDKCDKRCTTGNYGPSCDSTCDDNCEGDTCHHISGRCTNGCDPGWQNHKCDQKCETDKYGQDCNSRCNDNCIGDTCHHISGTCTNGCDPGWENDKCDKRCTTGNYGPSCDSTCDDNCEGDTCHHISGRCTNGCDPGWQMDKCNQTCDSGRFGSNCADTCSRHCKNGDICNHVDGKCTNGCEPGWRNNKCDRTCTSGSYGQGCVSTCSLHCGDNDVCDHVTGACPDGCKDGWQGSHCNSQCPKDLFGGSCNETCGNCLQGDTCDSTNGHCPQGCETGYKAPLCKAECDKGSYGMNCAVPCGNCSTADCNHIDGKCSTTECNLGWKGERCDQKCTPGSFGGNCKQSCGNCSQNDTCDYANGHCPQGCKPGYKDDICKKECDKGMYGINCSILCGQCSASGCNHIDGICSTTECNTGWQGERCDQVCGSGTYGLGCKQQCGHCSGKCNPVDGMCGNGECLPGYQGNICVEECEGGTYGDQCQQVCECDTKNNNCNHVNGTCTLAIPKKGSPGAAVGGAIVGLLLVVVVVLLVFFILRRKRKAKEEDTADGYNMPGELQSSGNGNDYAQMDVASETKETTIGNGSESTQASIETQPLTDKNKNDKPPKGEKPTVTKKPVLPVKPIVQPTNDGDIYENKDLRLKIAEVGAYIKKQKVEENGFENEYQCLPSGQTAPWLVAVSPKNIKAKNRYKLIYAYDHSRVHLKIAPNGPNSDYINANFIDGYKKKNKFIATQGPKNTSSDLWTMIWEQNVTRIVMVTNLREGNYDKCEQYWPYFEEEKAYGNITVTNTKEQEMPGFIIRTLHMKKGAGPSDTIYNNTAEGERTVLQFHFTEWPDKGVPRHGTTVLNFVRKIKAETKGMDSPIVVHCSAGVGRTGTFIALDYLLDQAEAENMIDVFSCVKAMRENRLKMVQTLEQYVFIYDTIHEAVMVGDTSIQCFEFGQVYSSMKTVNKDTGISRLQEQYQMLKKMATDMKNERSFKVAMDPENKDKNRSKDVVPDDMIRMFLSRPFADRNEYINAVLSKSYNKSNGVIITQLPLVDTVVDFWRLVQDFKVDTIVTLTRHQDHDIPYWPSDAEQIESGPFTITRKDMKNKGAVMCSNLVFVHGDNSRDICIAGPVDWPDDKWKPRNGNTFYELFSTIQTWQQTQKKPGKVIIQCLDGGMKSGMYAVVSWMYDMINAEQAVDIFQITKQIVTARPEFLTSQEQYEDLYNIAEEYMKSFQTYSNFQ